VFMIIHFDGVLRTSTYFTYYVAIMMDENSNLLTQFSHREIENWIFYMSICLGHF
jgi:hypothetical protein